MRIITLHCDYIRFKPVKKALKSAPELSDTSLKEVKECLVVLTSVESGDSSESIKQMYDAVKKTATEVNTKNIVLYPYAHLSSNLATPDVAQSCLDAAEKELSNEFKVTRAPFGYYKEFELKCKGHPLSELSKEFKAGGKVETLAPVNKSIAPDVYDPVKLLHALGSTKLDTSKLEDNDHRIIGQKLGLFMFNETAPGMPYWLPAGVIVYNELLNYWRIEHAIEGYHETATPLMNKSELYKISGHWEHYKDNMFIAETDEHEKYCLKPMNCPNAMIIFKSKQRSYKELPLRLSDADRLHRFERSGTLNGLFRVRGFQQDDSHNFISEDMIESEYQNIFRICQKFYALFGLEYSFRLGTRPEGFLGDLTSWNKAESILKNILKSSGKKFTIAEGDGAFYGPKIDILMKDSMGREWQTGTIQLDFQLPKRFELKYTDKDGQEKTPIVVHRVIYGSLERFIGVLLEHTNGALPLWLSPTQVRVISFTDRNNAAAERLVAELKVAIPLLRIDSDIRGTTVNDKIRDAELLKIPYMIVIGDKEEAAGTLAVRTRGDKKPRFGVQREEFKVMLRDKISTRSLAL